MPTRAVAESRPRPEPPGTKSSAYPTGRIWQKSAMSLQYPLSVCRTRLYRKDLQHECKQEAAQSVSRITVAVIVPRAVRDGGFSGTRRDACLRPNAHRFLKIQAAFWPAFLATIGRQETSGRRRFPDSGLDHCYSDISKH